MSSYASATTDFPVFGLLPATTSGVLTATIQSILDAVSSGEVDTVIQARTPLPIATPYNTGLVKIVCEIGALDVLTMRGFNPESPNDIAIVERAERARALLQSYATGAIAPPWTPVQPSWAVASDPDRGWYDSVDDPSGTLANKIT